VLLGRTYLVSLVVALLGLGLLAAVVVRTAGTAPDLAVSGGCPKQVRQVVAFGPERMIPVMRAVKTQVPHVFANLTSMGHPAWQHVQMQAALRLNQLPLGGGLTPPVRGLDRYEQFAVRACGRTAAQASVLVFLQFPNCQIPCAFGWAYVTPTRPGWHLWTSIQI